MASPAPTTHPRAPRFLWQALLILLPVAVLTSLGLLSLRQDRLLATEEAKERAGRFAQEIADRAMVPLFEQDSEPAPTATAHLPTHFEVSPAGQLTTPPPFDPVPLPSHLDPTRLTAASRDAWQAARPPAFAGNPDAAATAWTRFLDTQPPDDFAAIGLFELAQTSARRGAFDEAELRFRQLATRYPRAQGETGLPLAPLALWRAAHCAIRQTSNPTGQSQLLDDACSNLVAHPTALTPALLRQAAHLGDSADNHAGSPRSANSTATPDPNGSGAGAALGRWLELWESHQHARHLFEAARQAWTDDGLLRTNSAGATELTPSFAVAPRWIDLRANPKPGTPPRAPAAEAWLLTRFPPQTLRFRAWNEPAIAAALATARAHLRDFPPYFAVSLAIAGRTLPNPGPHPVLAERPARASAQIGTEEPKLKAIVYLANPGALYARQRQRTLWFMAIVLAAAVTALVGLGSAHRAFHRQLRLNELKSSFVSSVSHELRAPIASVRLLAESLERGTVTDSARCHEYFRLIGQECRRLSSLIDNVLDFSRIDQQSKRYEFEPTNVPALVAQSVQLLQPYAAERQVTLQVTQPATFDDQPNLDGRALQQALVNLIDNAVKHSPPGSTVTVELATRALPAPCLVLSVADHGPGVPPHDRERIFEPFCRLGTELRRETAGIGIGLSIVRHVAIAHGGRAWVDSAPDRGSRFVLELPLVQDTPPAAAPE